MSQLSYNEMERLLGLLWPTIKEELEVWINQLQLILEDSEDSVTLKDIHQAQGSLRALRSVIQMPEQLLANKQVDDEKESQNAECRD